MDGEITSTVDGTEIPTEDNQSNFGSGFGYQYGADDRTFYKILQRETDKRKVGMDESCSIQAPSFSCIKKNETTEVAS